MSGRDEGCECVAYTIRTDYGTGIEHEVEVAASCPIHGRDEGGAGLTEGEREALTAWWDSGWPADGSHVLDVLAATVARIKADAVAEALRQAAYDFTADCENCSDCEETAKWLRERAALAGDRRGIHHEGDTPLVKADAVAEMSAERDAAAARLAVVEALRPDGQREWSTGPHRSGWVETVDYATLRAALAGAATDAHGAGDGGQG